MSLIMVAKILFKFLLFLFMYKFSYTEVIYEKNKIIITEYDILLYQKLYKENYNLDINRANSIKDLVLINNVIKKLEINNQDFINKIDTEILIRLGKDNIENDGLKNFFRFSRIRDEFLINYFQNELKLTEVINIFNELDSLNLPISKNNCLIIDEVIDLKDNDEFAKSFFNNLKNNTQDFQIIINENKYSVCINELSFKTIESLIVEYIQIQTAEAFEKFVYEKSKN